MKRDIGKRGAKGNAMIEVALMSPWLLFLFVGVLDFGFYSYAAICTQNAARVAALANAYSSSASADGSGACAVVLQEMKSLPNTQALSSCSSGTCPSTTGAVSASKPVAVTACSVTGPDGASAAEIIVTYLSIPMIPIPGVLMGQMTITRTVEVPVLNATPVS